MQVRKHDPEKPFRITINRISIEQLDIAIAGLEERGFRVIKRGFTQKEVVCYSNTNKRHAKHEFIGTTKTGKAWAILEN